MDEEPKFEMFKLRDALYQCDWYEMPESYKKSIIICMARSQVPLELTVGGFYVFTIENFTGVIINNVFLNFKYSLYICYYFIYFYFLI